MTYSPTGFSQSQDDGYKWTEPSLACPRCKSRYVAGEDVIICGVCGHKSDQDSFITEPEDESEYHGY